MLEPIPEPKSEELKFFESTLNQAIARSESTRLNSSHIATSRMPSSA